jgi:predicted O-methyltransferase YrrM
MVEIGSTRSISENDSTLHLATYCNENNIHFITVDVDKNSIEMAKKRF